MKKGRKHPTVKLPLGQAELICNLLGVADQLPSMSENSLQALLRTMDKCRDKLMKRIKEKHGKH